MIDDTREVSSSQVLFLTRKIDEDSLKEICPELATRKPTILLIDCEGGSYYPGCLLRGSILNNDKVVGVVSGLVNSMAIPVFESCKVRIMIETATMFFHSGKTTFTMESLEVFNADGNARWLRKNQDEEIAYEEMILAGVKSDNKRPKEFLLTLEKIREWRRKEYRLSAKEALSYGLCDRVLPFEDLFAQGILEDVL